MLCHSCSPAICTDINSASGFVYIPPPPPTPPSSVQSGSTDLQSYNINDDAVRRQTFQKWPVLIIVKNHLAAAGFYYITFREVVCFAFCGIHLGYWEGDDLFKDHQRWSPSFGFIKGLFVGTFLLVPQTSPTHLD